MGGPAAVPKSSTRKGYDYRRCRDACVRRSIRHRIARKGVESKRRLGRHRWIVERTFAWLARYRRLTIRYERRAAMHRAFLQLACALICRNYLHDCETSARTGAQFVRRVRTAPLRTSWPHGQ